MKTTFKFIIAAMAASAVLTSCQKEMAIDNSASSNGGVRVISASFSAPTKSALDTDNKTPKFVGGETIKVSNTESSENCTISLTGGVATFSTTLTGTLTAVYPSTAAKMNGNVIDESAVLVSTVQDGTFASANIAMATGITTSATFANKTAVIKITPGAGESTRYVEVITAGLEIANSTSGAYTKKNKIHVNTTSADPVYVSILVPSGLKVQNLSFADGSNIKTAKDNTTAIAINTISTVTATGWDKPYVEINGLKWATMNIGATSSTDAGKYFAWGDVTGQTPSGSTFSTSFDWAHAPFNNGKSSYDASYFASVKDTECPGGILALKNDAANVNWGGSWRMPTKAEFDALASETKVWDSTNKGYTFGTSPNTIFLPTAGYGYGTGLYGVGDYGYYWSSSLNTDDPYDACYLTFYDGYAYTSNSNRYYVQSVRALSE